MTFSGLELQDIHDPLWFCLKAQPKREHIAAAALRQIHGLEVLAPRIRYKKPTTRGTIWFVEAMFPGYLFARFLYTAMHRQVQAVHGITNVVHFGDRVGVLPGPTVEQLRSLAGEDEVIVFAPELAVGQSVQMTTGAFMGLEAVITQILPAKERVKVLLHLLGREVEAQVSVNDILSTTAPRTSLAGRSGADAA